MRNYQSKIVSNLPHIKIFWTKRNQIITFVHKLTLRMKDSMVLHLKIYQRIYMMLPYIMVMELQGMAWIEKSKATCLVPDSSVNDVSHIEAIYVTIRHWSTRKFLTTAISPTNRCHMIQMILQWSWSWQDEGTLHFPQIRIWHVLFLSQFCMMRLAFMLSMGWGIIITAIILKSITVNHTHQYVY